MTTANTKRAARARVRAAYDRWMQARDTLYAVANVSTEYPIHAAVYSAILRDHDKARAAMDAMQAARDDWRAANADYRLDYVL